MVVVVVVCVQRMCMMSVTSVRVCESCPCLGKVCVFVCTRSYLCPGQNGHMLMERVSGMSGSWCLCPHVPIFLFTLSPQGLASPVWVSCVLGGGTHVCLELWRLLVGRSVEVGRGSRVYIFGRRV